MTSEVLLSRLEEAVSVSDHFKTVGTVNDLLQTAREENLEVLCPFAMDPNRPGSGNAVYLMINGKRQYVVFTSPEKFDLFLKAYGKRKVSLMPMPFREFLEEMKTRDSFGGLAINPSADASGHIDAGYVISLVTTQYWPERRK